jgi:hypothetical protein
MSNKRKKDTRISSVELKSLGLKDDVEELVAPVKSEKKKEKKSSKKSADLKQSKILDFVEPSAAAGSVDVSFDGRIESFSGDELALLAAFLRVKSALNKQQLALAVELWNTNPSPDVFQFLAGENEGRAISLADLQNRDEKLEHIMFREQKKVFISPAPPVAAPPPERQHKKK